MPEDHERISMEEQRRIHTRALSKSGPPAAGETLTQEEFRLECEANISRDRATAERHGLNLVYEFPFD
ncbi:hypothetical protein KBY75_09185 [Cyanobium sp. T1G-Tous]|uniref:hypothetical protein n=1 Tax=Cyanobium sp. T1G-Tous TaxID=2823722 RepID=UPI0020CBCFDD|nr:hypothetical protein [Cyanobium sp. T1G-Tous]MCP9803742.1 hypothetical protein [Cyanobium sp. T1G-Tous]